MEPIVVNATVVIPASELEWKAVRASGPGGQNVNKVASKVELRFALEASGALDDATKARLRRLAGRRLADDGWLTVTSQRTRDREQNLEDAVAKLRELVTRALVPPTLRRATRPTRGSVRRRLDEKRRRAERKRIRGRPGRDE